MKHLFLAALLTLLVTHPVSVPISDAEVNRAIIQQSSASYPRPCPCPYNRARNGSLCGRRSAYRRPGGYSPICYDKDVPPDRVRRYRASHDG